MQLNYLVHLDTSDVNSVLGCIDAFQINAFC